MKRKVQFCVLMTLLLTALSVNPVFAYFLEFNSVADPQTHSVTVNIYATLGQGEEIESADFSVRYDPAILQHMTSGLSTQITSLDFLAAV